MRGGKEIVNYQETGLVPYAGGDAVYGKPHVISLPHVAWRQKWLITLCVVVAVGAAAAYLAVTPPTYRATAEVFVQQYDHDDQRSEIQASPFVNATLKAHARKLSSTPVLVEALSEGSVRRGPSFDGVDRPLEALRAGLSIDAHDDTDDLDARVAHVASEIYSAIFSFNDRARRAKIGG